ncbi:similar to Saccharomyces cerevisiae YKL019W RAM2 Alpha subunit of both the farnesyltransferase and type I geranylgeranyltransferase [Maudiozyma saulgeensis]|uniref:Protein farnesyltransferase/geranylgeranyltransferase type-1 subunit alpha n=1 Tax=Maudiozyma saulgeensis TaxID=1789683 RepID=A0A1X7QWX6_9SACH|nr:similar to Saccharomyces cerevisiae YKL019W RAM2 Alpha subunit of both the farnesyltransferase and type I geranylgeranyltransferase [Kazachstania saulgeensis]
MSFQFNIKDYDDVAVVPLTHDGEEDNELCRIMYSEEYKQVMSLVRALIKENELSVRALSLTSKAIELSPAFYTVWNYRYRILEHLLQEETLLQNGHDASYLLNKELDWLDEFTLNNPKNYQIWSYRQALLTHLHLHATFTREQPIMELMIDDDSKNYHVWSYRKWCCSHFRTYGHELTFTEKYIERDVYNNSAWNHRLSVLKQCDIDFDQELQYAKGKIEYVPQNISTWTYLRGLLESQETPKVLVDELLTFTTKFLDESSYALEFFAYLNSLPEVNEPQKAIEAYTTLATKADPIRKNLWDHKIQLLQKS